MNPKFNQESNIRYKKPYLFRLTVYDKTPKAIFLNAGVQSRLTYIGTLK